MCPFSAPNAASGPAFGGQDQIDGQRRHYADPRIEHPVQRISDMMGRRVEQNDAQHYAAGLYGAGPAKLHRNRHQYHNAQNKIGRRKK